VLQAGGEDGMWTFDRYQRWMQQKRDWVKPAASAAPPASSPRRAPDVRAPVEISIDDDGDLAEIARKVDDSIRKR
jgi:hypothetical protein